MKVKKLIVMLLLVALILPVLPTVPVSAQTQQGGTIVLDPTREIDNLEMLPAAAAKRDDVITIFNGGVPKYFWIDNFGARSSDYLEWTVRSELAETTDYFAWLHINASVGTELKITVTQNDTSTETNFSKQHNGWEVAETGILKIPSGESTIKLTKVTSANQNIQIKGLDMIRESDKAAYLDRVASYKTSGSATRSAFSNSGYGLFFQYGVWGYPQFGPKQNAEDSTNDFDVDAFVDMLEATQTKFVIWSLTWWQYRMQMSVGAVDEIMGDSTLTTERDLVSEIAAAAKQRGIDFYLYYHQGIQQEPTWKAKQNWPNDFTKYGVGDRSTFFNNWEKVITEVGTTLGTNLDGWFFDDGCVYYPAPFERMAIATKAGNPNRIVSYNSWVGTKVTEFQDMIFGEGSWGDVGEPTVDGVFQSGREAGLQQVSMPMINNGNWGITSQDETITLGVNPDTIISKVKSASERKVPVALNIKMWEGGIIGDTTIEALLALKKAIYNPEQPSTYPVKNVLISSASDEIGLSSTMQMNATIIPQYASDKSVEWSVTDTNGGATSLATINSNGLLTSNNSTGTIKVIAKSNSDSMILAEKLIAIIFMPQAEIIYGNDNSITKTGRWTTRTGSKSTDSTEANAIASYTFTGNYIEWYGVKGNDHGIADIYIDDKYVTNVDLYSVSRETGTLLFRSEDLGGGQHSIKIRVQNSKNQAATNTYVEIYWFKIEEVQLDQTAPVTTATVSPAESDGNNGWYTTPVTVNLTAEDAISGVFSSEFSFDNGGTWQDYSEPLTIREDGQYTISYRSTDVVGNEETVKSISFKIDLSEPTIEVVSPVEGSYRNSKDLLIEFNVIDVLSGVDNGQTTLTLDGEILPQGISIPLYTLSLGMHELAVRTSDLAGNTQSKTITFHTVTSIESIKDLITIFTELQWINNDGIANSLIKKLNQNDLHSFINEVKAQTDKHVSSDASAYLIRDIQYLMEYTE